MLQRAASNAYSWWWASNIRTNQSKWLDNNLQDMEEKVKAMLKIIDEDADSFAKRAEMYYKKRPELMNFVEDTYKAYKALAERFDRISGELHKANHTIATAFPDQVQFAIQDEDDDCLPKAISSIDSSKIHKPPSEIPHGSSRNKSRPEYSNIKKPKHRRVPSQFSKEKAHEEIDRLQKAILVLQTEKEFIKSSYESGLAKFLDIERQIVEMQEEVCFLQDNFGASSVIEDDEARALMAAAALKSCEDTLVNLQEQQNRSTKEARIESERIKNAEVKLKTLKGDCNQSQVVTSVTSDEKANLDVQVCILKPERLELQTICEKVKLHFETNSEASVAELADKIDALVDKVIGLELTVSSQTVEIRQLKSETDELFKQLQSLEEEKMTLTGGSNTLSDRFKQAEDKLQSVQDLEKCVEDEKNILSTHLTDACCSLNDLSEKLQSSKCQDQHTIASSPSPGSENSHLNDETHEIGKEEEIVAKTTDTNELVSQLEGGPETPGATMKHITRNQSVEKIIGEVARATEGSPSEVGPQVESSSIKSQDQSHANPQVGSYSVNLKSPKEEGKVIDKASPESIDSIRPSDEADTEESFLNLQQLLSSGLEEREKILLAEYSSILRNYKEVKKKLSDVERKNQDSLIEIIAQLRDLKSTNAMKDEEIRLLRENLTMMQGSSNENKDPSLVKATNPFLNKLESFSRFSKLRSQSSKRRNPEIPGDPKVEQKAAKGASFDISNATGSHVEEINQGSIQEPPASSTIEEKFRRDIDTVLEENLDFWLRFSSTFHHVQKLQTTFEDLQTEIENLNDNKTSDGTDSSSGPADQSPGSVPIDKRLRELKTELQVWLEQNAMLKGELKQRFSSLCEIQDEISRILQENSGGSDVQFTPYQAAKFQGEVLNMQQENNKVSNELQAGLDHVRGLQTEVEIALSKLQEKFELSGSRSNQSNHHQQSVRNLSSSKTKIPLKSFLYGVKPKKPSIFSCMSPASHKQYNAIRAGLQPKRSYDNR